MERVVEHRGCRLAYSVNGSGPAVLFIQGVGVQGTGWSPQTTELAVKDMETYSKMLDQ